MNITKITLKELKKITNKEGIILQGCGGDPKEWVDGINDMLTQKEILLDNTRFENVSIFENNDFTCILFIFDNSVHLDISKLSLWRIQTHLAFAGTWLSDYIHNLNN